ncbi:MAG TPA: FAD-dependent oxidoreductase, partial [Dehalococcoidia bacterium]|nr:FAD-dependent oxidoreductase [Dehalococcoidia bacterium]
MPDRTVLVLGCGMAGVFAALELKRRLRHERVVVIDKAPMASYPPSHAALAVGEVRGRTLLRPRSRLARKGIEFVNAEVQHIDLAARQVRAAGGREVRFDLLVLATGTEPAFDAIPGLSDNFQSTVTFESAERLAASLRYFAGGRVLIATAADPKWAPGPYELAMLLEHYFHERKMRQKVEIGVAAPEDSPLARFGPEASELIAGQLAHKGIEFLAQSRLAAVDAHRHLARFEDGGERSFDLLITLPPQTAPPPLVECGLVDPSGRVPVDPMTLETSTPGVFALGDVSGLRAADGRLAPASAELARQSAVAVARQAAARFNGTA